MLRFLHDNAKGYTIPVQVESISVDETLNSTYQTREQLHLAPCKTQSQDTPPLMPAKHQTHLDNSCDNSSGNCHMAQDSHKQGSFRQRTAVMSSAEAKKYKTICCKSKTSSGTSTVTSPHQNQNSWTVKTANAPNEDKRLDKPPPPLPPKPVKLCTTNNSSVETVSQHREHAESVNLLEERMSVQPNQLAHQQIRSV